jgi:hypothetical protein
MRTLGKSLAISAALGLALATSQAHATLLPINSTVTPNAQANPLVGTTILANTGVQNFNVSAGPSSIIGTGQEWVVRGFAGNPFGAGDLTFVYQVTLTGGQSSPGVPAILERVTGSGYISAFLTDAGYNQSDAQVIPASASRSAPDIVSFNFVPPIGVGQTSALLIVNTNALAFTASTMTVQDGLTANLSGFSPAVPEPSSVVMMGMGAVALCGVALRRRARAAR